MESSFIQYGESRIHYLHSISGSVPVVALHGYGENSSSFLFLENCLGESYYLLAMDLPFHGLTQWNEGAAFTSADLVQLVAEMLNRNGFSNVKFLLIGYSMGGRMALALTQQIPEQILRILLLAPDGMIVNPWYWFATQTYIGNRIFFFTMKKPGWLFWLLRMGNRLNLINKSVFKFILNFIDDRNARLELFHRWTCMRTIKPDHQKIRMAIQACQIPTRMLYGKHDRIILSTRAEYFHKGLGEHCQLHVIDAGHNILQKKYAGIIKGLLVG